MVAVAEKKILAARSEGLAYMWCLELLNGEIHEQYDSAGTSCSLLDHRKSAKLLKKSPVDPYSTVVLTGVRRGGWLPTVDGLKPVVVDVDKSHEGLVLFRKTYQTSAGFKYYCFCVGVRFDTPTGPKESIIYVCPPTRMEGELFPGGATQSVEFEHETAFDAWMKANKK